MFKTFAKKKKDNFLSYGIDELNDGYQGEQEEIYRIDRNASNRENKMAKEYKLDIPLNFLENYFFHTLDTQEFNNVKEQLSNTLEKNEHYFLDLGADPKEIVQLESEVKLAQTPGIFDTVLERLYNFGNKYGIWFENSMQKGSAVTPARVFHKLLTAWKTADSPNWVPKIDRELENVSIEFSDSTRMSIFDDTSVDTFLSKSSIKASKNRPKKLKTMSLTGYQIGLFQHLHSKLGDYHTDLSTMEKLADSGYKIAAETILDTHVTKGQKIKSSGKVSFDVLAKHLDDYNLQLGHSIYSDTDVIIFKTSENVPSDGTDSEMTNDKELLLINATVTALKNRGFDVTAEDYVEWLTGSYTTNEGAERFNEIVIELLGEKIYHVFKRLNVLNAKLRFELGVGPPYVDGVDLTMDPEFSDVPEIDGCPIQSGDPVVVYVMNLDNIL
jgi:hypothetical protein